MKGWEKVPPEGFNGTPGTRREAGSLWHDIAGDRGLRQVARPARRATLKFPPPPRGAGKGGGAVRRRYGGKEFGCEDARSPRSQRRRHVKRQRWRGEGGFYF